VRPHYLFDNAVSGARRRDARGDDSNLRPSTDNQAIFHHNFFCSCVTTGVHRVRNLGASAELNNLVRLGHWTLNPVTRVQISVEPFWILDRSQQETVFPICFHCLSFWSDRLNQKHSIFCHGM
jgi:hypothetical protein